MVGERIMPNFESATQELKSEFSTEAEKDMASNKDVILPNSTSPPILGVMDPAFVAEQNLYYPPTNCYSYYYPGFDGFPPLDDQGYLSMGVPSDNSSHLYYLSGYNPYTTGFMVPDGENPYMSSGCIQPPGLYRPEPLQSHSRDSMCALDGCDKVKKSHSLKPMLGQYGSVKSSGCNASKMLNTPFCKPSDWTLNSNAQEFAAPPRSLHQTPRFGSLYKCPGNLNGVYPGGKCAPLSNQNHGVFMNYGVMNYQPTTCRVWNGNQKFRPKYNYRQEGCIAASMEITRGPRANSKGDITKLCPENGQEHNFDSDKYNLEDFQTDYDSAKFYVIKSYSEDDVHKSIKYAVWSSTPKGNKKLDDAFRVVEADAKATETGTKHPVFLFFSVNGSGQFVGAAEMTGAVDFNQNMDFWQVDKWSGFFPVKWHIVKDLPNHLFRHIILENNENRGVTHSRDSQEVGLKQGLEMLSICKSYSAKTSLLDDFNFYENREKSLKAKRGSKSIPETDDFPKLVNGGDRIEAESKTNGTNALSLLVNLTKNLSLEEQSTTQITC